MKRDTPFYHCLTTILHRTWYSENIIADRNLMREDVITVQVLYIPKTPEGLNPSGVSGFRLLVVYCSAPLSMFISDEDCFFFMSAAFGFIFPKL